MLQEALKKHLSVEKDPDHKSVTIFVQSKLFMLKGHWEWDLLSNAVFCSDVMFNFTHDLIGTKGIIHPDDIAVIHKSIYFSEAIGEEDRSDVEFRIITTYGEVRTLKGKDIQFVTIEEDSFVEEPVETTFKKAVIESTHQQQAKAISLNKEISQFSERVHQTGTWSFNLSTGETFYSDNYYRLFDLPPQSLNAQLYTFAAFLHPEDKSLVLEAIGKSIAEKLPLEIEYRIIRADDEMRYLQYISTINFTESGEQVVYGVVKDITETA